MKRFMGVVLIIIGLLLGYWGYQNYRGTQTGVQIGELEIEAENSTSKEKAYILLGGGVLSLILGVLLVASGRSTGDAVVEDQTVITRTKNIN